MKIFEFVKISHISIILFLTMNESNKENMSPEEQNILDSFNLTIEERNGLFDAFTCIACKYKKDYYQDDSYYCDKCEGVYDKLVRRALLPPTKVTKCTNCLIYPCTGCKGLQKFEIIS